MYLRIKFPVATLECERGTRNNILADRLGAFSPISKRRQPYAVCLVIRSW
jgi:hypothetical protein